MVKNSQKKALGDYCIDEISRFFIKLKVIFVRKNNECPRITPCQSFGCFHNGCNIYPCFVNFFIAKKAAYQFATTQGCGTTNPKKKLPDLLLKKNNGCQDAHLHKSP